jgi:hypothetical protein
MVRAGLRAARRRPGAVPVKPHSRKTAMPVLRTPGQATMITTSRP